MCSCCVCVWSFSPCALEYWRLSYNDWMRCNYDLVPFMYSL
ncbi:unnamed protein product [Arabidopsis arenosa]|uniref:Uncharacterized protein n=1 Tax=Arabidopsis arenosa TaxID=38785 RepID=A0A8S2B2T1_ARAAE|nr:unnamed protein product [Arabidopsis arenosa]